MSNEPEKSQPAPAPEPAPQEAAAPGGLLDRMAPVLDHAPEARDFLEKNGRSLLVGVVAAALIYVGLSSYRNYRETAARTAETLLFSAQTPEKIQEVVDGYASTPMAPLALLTLASSKFDAGEYKVAENLYGQFAQKHPQHSLREQAEFNIAVCQEADGRLEEALAAFTAFAAKGKDGYLYPEAVFGRARCLEQLARFPEAKAVYEDFVAANPTNTWGDRAQASILYVEKAQRASLLPKPAEPVIPLAPISLPSAAPAGLPSPSPSPAPAPATPPAAAP